MVPQIGKWRPDSVENLSKTDPRRGIQDLRAIDPLNIKKVKKVMRDKEKLGTSHIPMVTGTDEFFVYTNTDKKSRLHHTRRKSERAQPPGCPNTR